MKFILTAYDNPKKRTVGFKVSEGMEILKEVHEKKLAFYSPGCWCLKRYKTGIKYI
jgi:hypothetical protein